MPPQHPYMFTSSPIYHFSALVISPIFPFAPMVGLVCFAMLSHFSAPCLFGRFTILPNLPTLPAFRLDHFAGVLLPLFCPALVALLSVERSHSGRSTCPSRPSHSRRSSRSGRPAQSGQCRKYTQRTQSTPATKPLQFRGRVVVGGP